MNDPPTCCVSLLRGKILLLMQTRTSELQDTKKWETWPQRLLLFSWPFRGGSWCRPPCLRTTGRCPLWMGRSSPQLPSGLTCGKRVWPIPLACLTARTFLRCWLWMVSSEIVVKEYAFVFLRCFASLGERPSLWTDVFGACGFPSLILLLGHK